ncbi:MAG TPA: ABC transporter permease [Amycolatopsis sp.]|nr:ABC transporter permease [Amycolatopsis sp.]
MTLNYAVKRAGVVIAQLGVVVLVIWLWGVLSGHDILDPVYFSSPSQVWHELKDWYADGSLWHNLGDTMRVFAIGYVAGTVLGIVIGVLIGAVGWLRELTEPFLAFFNAMPRLILLPLLVVWFGFGVLPKVVLVMAVIVLMVALNVASGLREVRSDLLDSAKLKGAGTLALLQHVYIPSVALWVTSTARVTVGYAFNAAIAAEFIGANTGLGYLMYLSQSNFQPEGIWAALILTVVVAIVMDGLLALVEHRATRWMPVS